MSEVPSRRRVPMRALAALVFVLVLAVPSTGTLASQGGMPHQPLSPSPPVVRPAQVPYLTSTVYYDSSVDGFNLSYTEEVPASYTASRHYPLAIELHGLAGTETSPMWGGWPTLVNDSTVQAAIDAGFLLIVPNTRTGAGWYNDSAYTGPQQQDIFDAISHEERLRSVGPLYLYGFSMGGIGSLAIGLSHPGMFAGLGAVAMFSDMYQMLAYFATNGLIGVTNAFLLPVNDVTPQNSTASRDYVTHLSALRFEPRNASGTRMYFVDGAEDVLSTNNVSQWPYQQGNDSVLRSTCNVIAPFGEPANCTTPFAALSASDPANYTYRYLFEPEGLHAYPLLNATDLFAFFTGQVASGTYWGAFPDPRPYAPPRPLVTLATDPYGCGTISYDARLVAPGAVESSPGSHTLAFASCPGMTLEHVRTTGMVTYVSSNGTLSVVGSGTAVGVYAIPHFTLTILDNVPCALEVNGQFVSNGSSVSLAAGSYPIGAPACAAYAFESWSVVGGLSVDVPTAPSTTLHVAANGTLSATFTGGPPPPTPQVIVHVSPPTCGPLVLNGTRTPDGTVVLLAAGTYLLQSLACPGYTFDSWASTGGVNVGAATANASLTVAADGTVTAVYAPGGPPVYTVGIHVDPAGCGSAVTIDGVSYADSMSAFLLGGNYTLAAGTCAIAPLAGWHVSGGIAAHGATLEVSGNGSLTATYANSSSAMPVGANDSGSFPILYLVPVFAAAVVLILAGAVWLGRRAAERRRHLPPGETEGTSGPKGH